MVEWATVRDAMRGARRRPVRGRVTAHRHSEIMLGAAGGVPFMPVFLHPEGLDLARAEGALRLDRVDGTPHYLSVEGRAWTFAEDRDRPVTTESRFVRFIGPGLELVSASDRIDESLDGYFPSGPVREDERLGRPVWIVPGTIDHVPAEIAVDQATGVLLSVAAVDGDWSAEFASIEFPKAIDPAISRWEGDSTEAQPLEIQEREDGTWTAEEVAVPEPPATGGGARVLHVRMDKWLLGDGSVEPPRVGETVQWPLSFVTFDEQFDPGDRPGQMTLLAEAIPIDDSPPKPPGRGPLRWSTHLQGDGWSATWDAPRPIVGVVRVHGELWIDAMGQAAFPARQTSTRGRISRVRLKVARQHKVRSLLGRKWETIRGRERWIDVETSPRVIGSAEFSTVLPDGTREFPVDVVVDLDLDSAAPPEPRPRVVPATSAACGRTLWAVDGQLPLVVRLDLDSGRAIETILPLPVAATGMFSGHRFGIRPDATGCWVLTRDSRYRIGANGELAEPEHLGAWSSCVYDGRTMLVLGDDSALVDADGLRRTVEVPAWESVPVEATRREGDPYYVVALRTPDVPMRPTSFGGFIARDVYRVATIGDDGEVTAGPELEFRDMVGAVGIVDGIVQVVTQESVHSLADDLSVATVRQLPTIALESGFVGDRMWILTHHPDGTGPFGWWPHLGNEDSLRDDGRLLFVLLDPSSLEPTGMMGVNANYLRVTEDAEGTVWVSGSEIRGLRTDGTVARIDLADAVERSVGDLR